MQEYQSFLTKIVTLLEEDKGIQSVIFKACANTMGNDYTRNRWLSVAEDNFIVPKAVLCAVLKELAWQYEPNDKSMKKVVEDIRPHVKTTGLLSTPNLPEYPMVNGVFKCMDCSTIHITKDANTFLNEIGKDTLTHHLIFDKYRLSNPYDYGFWLHVPNEESLGHLKALEYVPYCIFDVLEKAQNLGCYWVKLDRDGEHHEDLNKYNW